MSQSNGLSVFSLPDLYSARSADSCCRPGAGHSKSLWRHEAEGGGQCDNVERDLTALRAAPPPRQGGRLQGRRVCR